MKEECLFLIVLLLACGYSTLSLSAEGPQAQLLVQEPLYCNMPVWVHVKVIGETGDALPEDFRYPAQGEPWFFGGHNFVVRRADKTLPVIPEIEAFGRVVPRWGSQSAAPAGVRRNWFPLHLWYCFDTPGIYSIQYSNADLPASSDWVKIEVRPFTPEQRNEWLKTAMATPPTDAGKLVSEYLPSLLACPDRRSLNLFLNHLHHEERLVEGYATYGLYYYDESLLREEIPKLLEKKGPTDYLAHFLSWEKETFQPVAPSLVKILSPFLASGSPRQAAAAVRSLGFIREHYSWDGSPQMKDEIARLVFHNLDALTKHRDGGVLCALAVFMGGVKTDSARKVLWELTRRDGAREQALICLAWHGDKEDLARLAEIVLSGDEKASRLPYHLHRAYAKEALPYLLKGLRECPNDRTKLYCAEELALEDVAEAFEFFRDQIEGRGKHKEHIVQFVRDHFKIGDDRSEKAVLDYTRLRAS
jgi:hypothetical protein